MAAGGLPTVQVLLDDGTGTFPYDVTTKARVAYTVSRGRQDEAASVNPGQLALTFENDDGRFTLGSTIIATPSPIKVDTKVRVKVTANAVTRNRSTDYAQTFPVAWPSGSDLESLVTVLATDAQARAERRILRSVIEEEISLDTPSFLYLLDEPATAVSAADRTGRRPVLSNLGGSVFGSTITLATGQIGAVTITAGALQTVIPEPLWITGIIQYAAFPSLPITYLNYLTNNGLSISVSSSGIPKAQAYGLTATGPSALAVGTPHELTAVLTPGASGFVQLFADGVLVATSATGSVTLDGGSNYFRVSGQDSTLFARVAGGSSALSSARAIAHQQASSTGFAGESGTARITRLAGYAGVPLGTLDTSLTNVAFVDITDKTLGAALRDVADAEFGLVFFDGSGNLTFHNRNRAPAKTAPDITLAADQQISEGTAFIVDTQGLLNYYSVTADGTKVTQVARNTASEATHGRYSGSASYLVQTDAEAIDRGNWTVAVHAEPAPRVGTLVIDLMSLDAATQSALLAAEPNTWIRITGLPSQTPGGTTADLMVQGFTETLTNDSWSIAFNVSNRSLFTAWILGDATYGVLGSTTRLYV